MSSYYNYRVELRRVGDDLSKPYNITLFGGIVSAQSYAKTHGQRGVVASIIDLSTGDVVDAESTWTPTND